MTHVIQCPACNAAMREVERENIMIDICTRCRGVWLDHGELDKIISAFHDHDRADERRVPPRATSQGRDDHEHRSGHHERRYKDDDHDDDDDHFGRHGSGRPRKRSAFQNFMEIFD